MQSTQALHSLNKQIQHELESSIRECIKVGVELDLDPFVDEKTGLGGKGGQPDSPTQTKLVNTLHQH